MGCASCPVHWTNEKYSITSNCNEKLSVPDGCPVYAIMPGWLLGSYLYKVQHLIQQLETYFIVEQLELWQASRPIDKCISYPILVQNLYMTPVIMKKNIYVFTDYIYDLPSTGIITWSLGCCVNIYEM